MSLHLKLLSAAALAVALTACAGREDNTPDAGCVGACGDAGTDAGENTDAGTDAGTDGGETGECTEKTSEYTKSCTGFVWDGQSKDSSIEQARYGECFGQKLKFTDMVVVGIDDAYVEADGPRRNFWVVAKNDPSMGLIIHRRGTDTRIPAGADVNVGDVVNVTGFLGTHQNYRDRTGRRFLLNNLFKSGALVEPLIVETTGTQEVTPVEIGTPACFGDAEEGNNRPNPEHAGALVHIPGPIELTNASPAAFARDTSVQAGPAYAGYEVSGGILISDYKTADLTDAEGTVTEERCDWRKKAITAAAEGKKIVFPNGITGVWDSYTHAPCTQVNADGSCKFNKDGTVPGTTNFYTYALYPQSCDDVVAEIVAQ